MSEFLDFEMVIYPVSRFKIMILHGRPLKVTPINRGKISNYETIKLLNSENEITETCIKR